MTPLEMCATKLTWCFNHGQDIDSVKDTAEVLYREIDLLKPSSLWLGSHHCILLINEPPKNKNLDLSSVYMILPLGSSVPETIYEDLKKTFKNLVLTFNVLGMTEISVPFTFSNTSKHYGGVGPGAILKLVDPETGKICGPDEIGEIFIKTEYHTNGKLTI